MTKIPVYRKEGGRVVMPLALDPSGSLFVVFRHPDALQRVTGLRHEGGDLLKPGLSPPSARIVSGAAGRLELLATEAGEYLVELADGQRLETHVEPLNPQPVEGPWTVTFPPGPGAPDRIDLDQLISWTEHDNPGVKFFAGTATYRKEIDIPADMLGKDREIFLDLGKVKCLAELSINGKNLGVLWKPPFLANVTNILRSGRNLVEVEITNLWPNRLIGDARLPDDCQWNPGSANGASLVGWPDWLIANQPRTSGRLTFASWRFYDENSPLLESGLLGPVRLVPALRQPVGITP